MMTNRSWIADCMVPGWRYEWRAREFHRRVSDCWGFVFWVQQRHFGRRVPDYLTEYTNSKEAQEAFLNFKDGEGWRQVDEGEQQVGDIALIHHQGLIHAGVVTSKTHMIQLGSGGVSQLHLRPGRVEGFYRHVDAR